MSPWKSPILYVGILLVLAVVTALAAPFIVDWNGYRADIENYGKRLTGREVKITGPVAVHLFPRPSLTLHQVSVANPAGAADPHLMEADKIVARVTLGGLFSGSIDVQSIDVVQPIFSLERLATGQGTWRVTPAGDLGKSRLLEHVKLEQIHLIDGAVRLADHRRGGVAVIEKIAGTLSAPAIAGPWRARLAANYAGADLAIAFSTGQWRADEPLKFAFTLTPPADSGFTYSFDGENDGRKITGVLSAEPQPVSGGKDDALPAWRSLAMTTKVTSDFDRITLDDIEIASRRPDHGGTLVSGGMTIALGASIGVDARLAAPRFDLDAFTGDGASLLDLAALASVIDALPEAIDGKLAVKIAALKMGGAVLENATLDTALAEGVVRIGKLQAKLPGQSEALFEGVLIADPDNPQLGGNLAVESANLRELARWAAPWARDAIAGYWKGNRGRLKLETQLDITPGRLRLKDAEFELDGAPGSASLHLATGEKPGADVSLAMDVLDIDGFVPSGTITPAWLEQSGSTLLGGAAALKIDVKAGKLRLNGTEAETVTLDARADAAGMAIDNLSIGKVEGAKLALSGTLKREGDAFDGALQLSVAAEQPRGLLRLFGLIPGGDPVWLGALGATDLAIDAKLTPKDGQPSATLHIAGQSGDLSIDGTLALSRGLDWRSADIAAVAEIAAKRGAALAALAGLRPLADAGLPGHVALTLTGTLANGLTAALDAETFGTTLSLEGEARQRESGLAMTGIARLASDQASGLWQAIGCGGCGAGPIKADAAFEASSEGLRIGDLKGEKNGASFAGELAITSGLSAKGDISIEEAGLGDLLGLVFMRWDGDAPRIEAPLTARLSLGLAGEVWIRPKVLHVFEGLDVNEAQIGISAVPGETRLAISSPGDETQQVALEMGAREQPGGVAVDGRLSLPIDLGHYLKSGGSPVATGLMRVEATFSSSGRSAAAALAELKADGGYQLKGVKLAAIDAPAFLAAAEKADSGAALQAALAALVAGPGIDIADRGGSLSVSHGTVDFLPVNLRDGSATIAITPGADLPSGVVTLDTLVSFDGAGAPPPLSISHAGNPPDLTRTIDAGKTISEFGLRILRQGVDELERLQREQERQAAEEEEQRRKDAARVADWEAHRQEMARRQRESRTLAEMQTTRAAAAAEAEQRLLADYADMNRRELDRRVSALRAYRNLRRATASLENEATPVFGSEAPVPKPRPKRKTRVKPSVIEPEPGLPIVLVPPDPNFSPDPPPPEKPKVRRNFNIR